jgi:hypothetical protein
LNRIWQVFWLVSFIAPSRVNSGILQQNGVETYSSGDCPGFTPVFPFNLSMCMLKTKCKGKGKKNFQSVFYLEPTIKKVMPAIAF